MFCCSSSWFFGGTLLDLDRRIAGIVAADCCVFIATDPGGLSLQVIYPVLVRQKYPKLSLTNTGTHQMQASDSKVEGKNHVMTLKSMEIPGP
mmetsp:Transcript_15650/g.24344  ORF Transcript_15650/g.24344 Transcript_15650/m.24344 type:complete len:92 (-) Transcript_15650:125-400(-)